MLAPFTMWSDTQWFLIWSWRLLGNPGPLLSYSIYPPPFHLLTFIFIKPISMIVDPSNFAVDTPQELQEIWSRWGFKQFYVTTPIFNLVYKLPYMTTDLLIGLILYRMTEERLGNPFVSRNVFALWYINPFIMVVSSVMGQNDSIVSLAMLLSVFLLLHRSHIFAGISVSLAFLLKTYNVLTIPFLLVAIGLKRPASLSTKLAGRMDPAVLARFAAGFALPFLLLLPSLRYFGLPWQVRVTAPNLGGFTFWGVLRFSPSANWIIEWGYSMMNNEFILGVAIAAASTLIILLKLRDLHNVLIFGILAVLTSTFLGLPLVNPHNLLILLPFMILASVESRRYTLGYWLLSCSGFVYIMFMLGPFVVTEPWVIFVQPHRVNELVQITSWYMTRSGFLTPSLNYDLMTISSTIGFGTLVSLLVPPMRAK